jgi:hypothetical protein
MPDADVIIALYLTVHTQEESGIRAWLGDRQYDVISRSERCVIDE